MRSKQTRVGATCLAQVSSRTPVPHRLRPRGKMKARESKPNSQPDQAAAPFCRFGTRGLAFTFAEPCCGAPLASTPPPSSDSILTVLARRRLLPPTFGLLFTPAGDGCIGGCIPGGPARLLWAGLACAEPVR